MKVPNKNDSKKGQKINNTGIPEHELEALARILLPEIQKYFESEEGQREFAEWKAQQSDDSYNGK